MTKKTLPEQARIVAGMIALGERIAHGRDVDLLLQLAAIAEAQEDVITRLKYEVDAIPAIKAERDALMSAAKLALDALSLMGDELNVAFLLGIDSPFEQDTTLKARAAIAALRRAGVQ